MAKTVNEKNELDRIVAAFAANGITCSWLWGEWDERDAARTGVNADGVYRTISSIDILYGERLNAMVCGDELMHAEATFNAFGETEENSWDALRTWLLEIYQTPGGNLGHPGGWPVFYNEGGATEILFMRFQPVDRRLNLNAQTIQAGNGVLNVSQTRMEMIWRTANYSG